MPLKTVGLNDKYTAYGTVLMSGTQALVRLPMLQRELDRAADLNTAGYISGYRGSPIGGYDQSLWRVKPLLKDHQIIFEPGMNEDVAATAIWGTQQLASIPEPLVDGVFCIWYAKAPGIDRSCDALKHANYGGSHPKGGVLVVAGDDHSGKSSTLAAQSELALMHCGIPILAPANVQDCLDMGLQGFALSRYAGVYVGYKATNETLELTATADVGLSRYQFTYPDKGELPPEGIHFVSTHIDRQRSEVVANRYRMPLVHKFVRANNIDRCLVQAEQKKLGIVTAGKATQDVIQALNKLGIDQSQAKALGISIYQVGCVWPLEPEGFLEFANGHEALLFVEEKRAVVQPQATELLYGTDQPPKISGKQCESGILLPDDVQLDQSTVALAIYSRLLTLGIGGDALADKADIIRQEQAYSDQNSVADIARAPFFCSGCPHNSSLKKPDGSYAAGGIGCHAMALFHHDYMLPNTHMGGEGAQWVGLAHFTGMKHIFQNMGDGTYYHSGILAIRAAVASGHNITYKILFNDAVAMTGGQPVEGDLSVGAISRQVLAEGARECVVVSDRPELLGPASKLAAGVKVHHRDELEAVQIALRDKEGVTVLIYEQTCAAEKRRRRKRGNFPDPAKRQFINAAVCEGCGDCSVKSSCVSLVPNETELGRKRIIDQSTCNKDYSCVKGFCPSFVTVKGGELRKPEAKALGQDLFKHLPRPIVASAEQCYGVMIAGIGGTGVVTVGSVLAMAAHLDDKQSSVFDMTGLSQKNGAVYSHLRIANSRDQIGSQRLGAGEADLVLAFDMVAAQSDEPLTTINQNRSQVVANTKVLPTAAFQYKPDMQFSSAALQQRFVDMVGSDKVHALDASGLGLMLSGDSIAANMMLVGYATQLGLMPLSIESIEKAIDINGVAVDFNITAFRLGRLCADDANKIEQLLDGKTVGEQAAQSEDLDEIIAYRVKLLSEYQHPAYADHYRKTVQKIVDLEAKFPTKKQQLAKIVARYYAKLMAYKDEYEVARLYSSTAFKQQLKDTFQGDYSVSFNLAPPLISRLDKASGLPVKREFGAWMMQVFHVLKRFKGLRGTAFDIFGYSAERKSERLLISDYEQLINEFCLSLNEDNYDIALELAAVPEHIRGYGYVKERHQLDADKRRQKLTAEYKDPSLRQRTPELVKVYEVTA